ncbi:SagB/ThcOx family dehydrogenase [Nonomuraea sp. MG754425]|uniref:SagB/ThcOx family dehydrogenase n=1 Tax=Nonomuraea sp. MG754425 TaxID=2570319 RepID=UPI001F3455B3|nr:SagB/ThcOx family dehydrogenase [Nonomuraea sp. MG754425]MCF6471970.1 SagB/ThcOx family dehydrogenase [Nonomuraea sp. MG754425]
MDPSSSTLAELYHENSKQRRYDRGFGWRVAAVGNSPAFQRLTRRPGKRYGGAREIALPRPEPLDARLHEAIAARRSARRFSEESLTLPEVASLLLMSAGLPDEPGGSGRTTFRAAPSAGGLHPTEIYLVVRAVDGLAPGVYHYRANDHVLETLLLDPAASRRLADASSYPEKLESAAVTLVLTAVFGRTVLKYGERAYRFVVLEIGHVAQNVLLVAAALGCGAIPIGGFVDDEVHAILDVDGVDEASFYLLPVGRVGPGDPPEWREGQDAVAAVMARLWAAGPGPSGEDAATPG